MLVGHVAHGRETGMSNFATFSTWFENVVQQVDPSVSLPYFDEDGELGGKDFESSSWVENYSIEAHWEETSSTTRQLGYEEDGMEVQEKGVDVVKVQTIGKFTYVPIITHNERRQGHDGDYISVSKGFAVPLITKEGKEKDEDSERDKEQGELKEL